MSRRVRAAASVALVVAVCSVVNGGNLVSCPDCGQAVSRRAFMCPKCGCRGEVIETAARELAKRPKPKEPDKFLRADFGNRVEIARSVIMDGARYAVIDFEKVVGLDTLILMFATTNTIVSYGKPQLAKATPLLRFPIAETNLAFTTENDTNVWETIQPRDLRNREKMLERLNAYKKGAVK